MGWPRAVAVVGVGLLAGCTPPWYRLRTVEIAGELLPGGRCAADVRGDARRLLALPADGGYVEGANLPAPLPPATLVITCGSLGPSTEHSKLQFFIPVPDTARGVALGTYAVVSDDASPTARARPGVAAFAATIVPDAADQSAWRHYRADGGALTLIGLERTLGGDVRVTGHFRVRAHRYVRFE